MIVAPIKTIRVAPGEIDILSLLEKALPPLKERTILAITSKVVSLCENRVVPIRGISQEELIKTHSDYYLPDTIGKYGYHFTITNNTLISMAGIDESNGNDNYILWPKDAQKTANQLRRYLSERFELSEVGVIVTDSTCQPMRLGTTGISIAHSGFAGLTDYVGSLDLFGRPFQVTRANIVGGLAASAVLIMGEGAEQTPLCLLSELPFVKFQQRDPTTAELANMGIDVDEDLYAPFIKSVEWQKGQGGRS